MSALSERPAPDPLFFRGLAFAVAAAMFLWLALGLAVYLAI